MRKKATVAINFNWIYVGIVGGILLLSALVIISNVKKSAKQELVFDTKAYLENIYKNIQLSKKSETSVKLPDVEIIFECNSFYFEDAELSNTPLTDNIVFSPKLVKQEIFGYSLSFFMPFEAEYFSYITSPGVKYVFIE